MPLSVTSAVDHVVTVEFDNPPNNFFDVSLLRELADAYERLDGDPLCRAIVLCSTGRHFCAGADFGDGLGLPVRDLYVEADRLFSAGTPVVAAVQGAAVGGGLGLALSADFRVAAPSTRFQANFARLGIHQGFGLSVTLPETVGRQCAQELLYTGRAVQGEEARELGLCDRLVGDDELHAAAHASAAAIATNAPLAVRSIRVTLRDDLVRRVRLATEREATEQERLFATEDFHEGVRAGAERRPAEFTGR